MCSELIKYAAIDLKLRISSIRVVLLLHAWGYLNYIMLEARERWLVRLRPFLRNLTIDSLFEFYYSAHKVPMVYIIGAKKTSLSYIGSTTCFKTRLEQHVAAIRSTHNKVQRVHSAVRAFGYQHFAALPLVTSVPWSF
jgi:hypothetical protein